MSKLDIWGHFGKLAVAWANAFLSNHDALVLKIVLSKAQLCVDVQKDVQWESQLYMNKQQMIQCLLNLQNAGILKIFTTQNQAKNQIYQYYDQASNISHCQFNENIVAHLSLFLKNIVPKFNDHNARTRDSQGKLTCKSCGKDYLLTEVHLLDIRQCTKCLHKDRALVPKQHDQLLERNVSGLDRIIKRIRELIENCDGEQFPTEAQLTQQTQEERAQMGEQVQATTWSKLGESEEGRRARKHIVAQRRKYFSQRNRILDFLERKRKLLRANSNTMQMEQ